MRGEGGHRFGIGARTDVFPLSAGGPGEARVSSTVKDLVVRSGIRFVDRGALALKGVPGEWRLFAVERNGDSG